MTTRKVRRLEISHNVSAAWLIDALSLLPPDTMVTGVHFDINKGCSTYYLVHPEFSEVEEFVEIPRLDLELERFHSFFGDPMFRPAKLIDSKTKQEYTGPK